MSAAQESMSSNGQRRSMRDLHASPDLSGAPGDSRLSAMADGVLEPAELAEIFATEAEADLYQRWDSYQLVGEALRGQSRLVGSVSTPDFLAGFRAKMAAEQTAGVPGVVQSVVARQDAVVPQQSPIAANDASFRWKMVAMAASVSAVMAVSWSLLGTGATGTVPASAGPVIASTDPVPTARAVASQPTGAVIVNTTQGPLIRDARLEALMAEHRQYGGMSALQMPAGFLRNATYDAPER
ncbi:MAG: sigma-E factor negative regulatory protein [Hydrogenophaga sp.]|jgi:sigma-E factor negative regulatory protein RseA|nr:sigma-E factor negative regulatory protein [Hydrogenophaga sp.]